jgi:hypothetical protein
MMILFAYPDKNIMPAAGLPFVTEIRITTILPGMIF